MPRDESKPDTKEFELRPGNQLVGPVLRGLRREGNPGNIPLSKHQHLQNARLTGGDIECRGGQERTGDQVPACVPGLDGGDDDLSLIAILINEEIGCGTLYNPDLSTPTVDLELTLICNVARLPNGPRRVYCGHADPVSKEVETYCYGFTDGTLWRLSIPADSVSPATDRTWVRVCVLGANVDYLASAVGVIWVAYTDGSVKYVDPASGTLTDAGTPGTAPVVIGQYREQVYAASEQDLSRWDGGTTWTSVSSLPDTVQFSPRDIRQVQDVLYVAGVELLGGDHPDPGDGQFQQWYYAYDGSTVTSHRFSHHDGSVPEDGAIAIDEYQGGVIFAWNNPTENLDITARVENLNGDYVEITFPAGATLYEVTIGSILVAGGELFIAIRSKTNIPTFNRRVLRLNPDVSLFGSGAGTYFWKSDASNNEVASVATLEEDEGELGVNQAPADMVVIL